MEHLVSEPIQQTAAAVRAGGGWAYMPAMFVAVPVAGWLANRGDHEAILDLLLGFAVGIPLILAVLTVILWWPGVPPAWRGRFVVAQVGDRFVVARAGFWTLRARSVVGSCGMEDVAFVPGAAPGFRCLRARLALGEVKLDVRMLDSMGWPIRREVKAERSNT